MLMELTEVDLWNKFVSERSAELREELVMRSVPLVHFLLGRLGISQEIGSDYEDLAHQGLLGLIEAVDRFDPAYGTKFSTYAGVRIRGKVLDYLRSSDWMSRGARQQVRAIQNAISELWRINQAEPTEEQISEYLGVKVNKVQQALDDAHRVVLSLDAMTASDEENDLTFYDTIEDKEQINPAELLADSELREALVAALSQLSERDQLMLSLYYVEELTLKEIGKILEVSESRVSQIHSRAIINLKAVLNNE